MDSPAATSLMCVDQLSVTYAADSHAPVSALCQVSLEVRPGEVIGVLGESGSGKSTLGGALLRLLPAHARYEAGSVQFLGRNLLALSDRELRDVRGRQVSLIAQDPALALNPVMAVGDQIAEVIRAHAFTTAKNRRTRVEELLAEVGFDDPRQIYRAYPHQLSGGQRQRIVIAQAMACRPSLVVADEPTSKLDASLQTEILELMRAISRRHGTAFVLISHDPTVLAEFVDRIVVMYAGRMVEEGPTEDIFRRPLHPYTRALVRLSSRYLGGAGARQRFPAIAGESTDFSSALGCPFAARCPERMPVCTERDPVETRPDPERRVSCFKYGE